MRDDELIGLVPAAGKGVRLGLPYPKELYPVVRNNHYKPISQFVLDSLTASAVSHVVFVVNETKHQLMGFFGNGRRFGCSISYVVQETSGDHALSTSPGLAHALDSAYHLVRNKTVCFGMADTIMQPVNVFGRALASARAEDDAVLILFPTERPEKFGMVHMDAERRVLEIVDKPKETDLVEMWGAIVWRLRFTEFLHEAVNRLGISDFAEIMNRAIQQGFQFRGVTMDEGIYIDLGTYDEIRELDLRYREE